MELAVPFVFESLTVILRALGKRVGRFHSNDLKERTGMKGKHCRKLGILEEF